LGFGVMNDKSGLKGRDNKAQGETLG